MVNESNNRSGSGCEDQRHPPTGYETNDTAPLAFRLIWHILSWPLSLVIPKWVLSFFKIPAVMIFVAYVVIALASNIVVIGYFIMALLAGLFMRLLRKVTLVDYMLDYYVMTYDVLHESWEQAKSASAHRPWYEKILDYAQVPDIPISLPMMAATLAFCLITLWFIIPLLMRMLRRRIYKIRGFTGEARVAGSEFSFGEQPKNQVEILALSTFSSKVVGYGARVNDALVVPRHVIDNIRNYDIGVRGPQQTHILTEDCIPSMLASDLLYYRFTNEFWSKMGVGTLVPTTVGNRTAARIAGPLGVSSGWLSKRPEMGMLQYSGSTDFGYSGAIYFHGNSMFGMHTGSLDGINSGYSAELIGLEVGKLVPEVSTPEEIDPRFKVDKRASPAWTSEQLRNKLERVIKKKPDVRVVEEESVKMEPTDDEVNSIKELLEECSPSTLRVMRNMLLSMEPKTMTGHSPTGSSILMEEEEAGVHYDREINRLSNLTDKIYNTLTLLSEKFNELQGVTKASVLQISANVKTSIKSQDDCIEEFMHKHNADLLKQNNEIENIQVEVGRIMQFNVYDRLATVEAEVKEVKDVLKASQMVVDPTDDKKEPIRVQQEPPINRYGCFACNRSFRTRFALIQHVKNSHAMNHQEAVAEVDRFIGETRRVGFRDNVTKIKTNKKASFLDKRSTGRYYKKNSKSSDEEIPSMSTSDNQPKMSDMMMKLDNICELLLKVTVGLPSEKPQN
uniref:C2H2-type domain-containing protein n=1 Tax=Riboviria sp. TaxID=2585031 RepID=A0A8K1U4I9_9VIRU|nr:MAG: hypothetical protein 1 [Riboviria sp.]